MKINIGAGYKKFDGFVNVDNDPNCDPDYIVNLETDKLPFEDNSVEKVIAHHILEHIGDGYLNLIKELYRVCKHGAIIDVRVPYHHHEVFYNDPTHKRPITIEGLRMFSKKFNQRDIDIGSATSTLGIMLDVDFEIINYDYVHDSFYDEIIPKNTPEQNARLLREALNTTIEAHAVLTVVKE
jgi:SAM-dependent methyltransferase